MGRGGFAVCRRNLPLIGVHLLAAGLDCSLDERCVPISTPALPVSPGSRRFLRGDPEIGEQGLIPRAACLTPTPRTAYPLRRPCAAR